MIFVENAWGATRVYGGAPVIPAPRPREHASDGRTYRAEPFTDAELCRTAPTLRAPSARRKATDR